MKKPILSLFLALCILVALLSRGIPTASAETMSGTCGDNLTWNFEETTGTLTISGTGPMYDWSSYSYVPWRSISNECLVINIESGVTSIGSHAFSDCYFLERIEIPYGVESIGNRAFDKCRALREINFPNSITRIEDYAFVDCFGLTDIILPESVAFFGKRVFDDCSCINSVVILNPECEIYDGSFSLSSTSVLTLYGAPGSTAERYAGKYKYNFIPLADGMCDLGNHCYIFGKCIYCDKSEILTGACGEGVSWSLDVAEGCLTISGEGNIQDFGTGKAPWYGYRKSIQRGIVEAGITAIGDFAFYGCDKMTSVELPDCVAAIGKRAFYDCKELNALVLPSGLTAIGDQSFYWCEQLTSVTIPGSLESFGSEVFYNAGLVSVVIDDGVEHIGKGAFSCCGDLLNVTIPDSVTSIGEGAFKYCGELPAITLPEGLTTIEKETFSGCLALVSVKIPDQVTTIGDRAFYECDTLRDVILGDSVKTIGNSAFYMCGLLRNVSFPEGLTSIGKNAFSLCDNITSVTIPDSVTTVGEYAFSGCSRMERVAIGAGVREIDATAFRGSNVLKEIWVDEKNTAYSCDEEGVLFDKEKTIVLQCPAALEGGYTIPQSVTSIGEYAFFLCSGLESIYIPNGVTSVGAYAFYGCEQLSSVTMPETVTHIGSFAFISNSNLRHIHFIGAMPTMEKNMLESSSQSKLCYKEGMEGWENCAYTTELWDYTCTTDCTAYTYSCKSCEAVYTYESEDAHSWGEGEPILGATCTESGSELLTCLDCGETKIAAVAPLGHRHKAVVSETQFYWEYSCWNCDEIIRIERDPRIAIMTLKGVEVTIAEGGDYPWVFGEDNSSMGYSVIQSSNQGVPSTTSAMTVTFRAKADFVISFSYGVSGEKDCDKLTISLDGTVVAHQISGEATDSYTSDTLPAGTHSLTLTYTKDSIGNKGTDTGYLYQIVAEALETGCSHSTATFVEAKASTCTVPGNIAYGYCPGCETYFADEEMTTVISEDGIRLPLIDHIYTYLGKNGEVHTAFCMGCDAGMDEYHSYINGKCICGKAESKEPVLMMEWKIGHTLNLASDISVTFAVQKSVLAGFDMDTVYIISKVDTYEGNLYTGERTYKLLPVEKGNLYYFTLTGLTAVNMNDGIRSVLYGTKDGQEYYSERDDYSIAEYAYGQLERANTAEGLKRLCANLLQYGAYAQRYKNYRTDYLVDASMTEAYKAFLKDLDTVAFGKNNVVQEDLKDPKITWAAKALDLASKVTLKLIFSPGNYTGNIEELSLRLTFTGVDGKTVSAEIQGAELYNANYGVYAFSFDGLLAAELRTVISAQIYEGDTPVSCTMQYSADTYGNNMTGALGDLCKALFAYSDSAKEYFA